MLPLIHTTSSSHTCTGFLANIARVALALWRQAYPLIATLLLTWHATPWQELSEMRTMTEPRSNCWHCEDGSRAANRLAQATCALNLQTAQAQEQIINHSKSRRLPGAADGQPKPLRRASSTGMPAGPDAFMPLPSQHSQMSRL